MGIEKFINEAEEIKVPKKTYKNKVDKAIEEKMELDDINIGQIGLNLLEMEEEKQVKKTAVSIYFEQEDLDLLKAISKLKNTTVNKTVLNILETTIKTTRANLPEDFNIAKLVKEYDKKNKNKGKKSN